MEKTWRWFGKKDKITLDMLRQIGVEGIVTALHDVPNGEIWTEEAINDLKTYIESYGLRWSVVESLPVCEAIKYAGPEREQADRELQSQSRQSGQMRRKDRMLQLHARHRLDTHGLAAPLGGRHLIALLRPGALCLFRPPHPPT